MVDNTADDFELEDDHCYLSCYRLHRNKKTTDCRGQERILEDDHSDLGRHFRVENIYHHAVVDNGVGHHAVELGSSSLRASVDDRFLHKELRDGEEELDLFYGPVAAIVVDVDVDVDGVQDLHSDHAHQEAVHIHIYDPSHEVDFAFDEQSNGCDVAAHAVGIVLYLQLDGEHFALDDSVQLPDAYWRHRIPQAD